MTGLEDWPALFPQLLSRLLYILAAVNISTMISTFPAWLTGFCGMLAD